MAKLFENANINISDTNSDLMYMFINASEKYKQMFAPMTVNEAAKMIIFGINQSTDLTDDNKAEQINMVNTDLQLYQAHKFKKRDFFTKWQNFLNRGKTTTFK